MICPCFSSSTVEGSDTMKPSKADLRVVNLEAAIVVRSIQHFSWQPEHLPPVDQEVVLLVVGSDNCLFTERLSFLIELSEAKVQGRRIKVKTSESFEDAAKLSRQNKQIIYIVALKTVSDHWDTSKLAKRGGLIAFGQGDSYLKRGLAMSSVVQNNRLRVSVNLRKLKQKAIKVDDNLLSNRQILLQ
tara:strand:- start:192 stop:752 length:561 start_codon:yes stop_codon:yes gene_type:complete